MKPDIKILLIVVLVSLAIPMFLFGWGFYFQETQDLQLYDTYYVFWPFELSLVVMGPILFVTFLLRALKFRFKNRWANVLLMGGSALLILIAWEIFEITRNLN